MKIYEILLKDKKYLIILLLIINIYNILMVPRWGLLEIIIFLILILSIIWFIVRLKTTFSKYRSKKVIRMCTKCGQKINAGSKFCNNCGYEIKSSTCGNCGFDNDIDYIFCVNCGQKKGDD